MRKIVLVVIASVMLSPASGCFRRAAIPDPTIPHRVAKEAEVEVWVRLPDGRLTRVKVRLLKGWWIAGPPVVEVEPER